jgi:thioredoxin 1
MAQSANVHTFNADNWQKEVVESDVPVLVDFWAPWCGPCRQLGPTIDRIADQFAGKIKVGKVNVDDNQDLAVKYGINNIPRVYLFKGGETPQRQFVGLQREADYVKAVNELLGA